MSMNIGSLDPRTIKELLQLQTINKAGLLSSNPAGSDGSDGDFAELLEGLMATQAARQNAAKASGAALTSAASSAMSKSPLFANGAFGSSGAYWQEQLAPSHPTDFEPIIQEASQKFGVRPSMIKAVIEAESSFNPRAVSQAGAKGLMQLMDSTGADLGVTNAFDPAQNIAGGTQYLSDLLMKYNGNQGVALAAYNAGPGRLDRLGIRTDQQLMDKLHLLPKETQNYVRKVRQLQTAYELS
ncbi:lytic transglycosylase domain-containing protein [Paenibacillus validus]|uniref:Transglycosylase SLT domain-containing protein n=1 Tax=Paenibacillus validus TaxID=44253 RepID=A0A7X3CTL3_9BACL|nr:lytic transglycosylase domain-containing protein [Paenibacillus validus]MED4602634.1 lytic transglycosylase domain-containing protein [Paenibacillus validus]MED4608901.1 lytic transglycosylase domain-containing protein [Paenibacillus validus]MUG72562.1 transglycosylase SLT domain-containing protein [Paenibacillus validus]